MTPETCAITNTMFRFHLREAAIDAERAAASPDHMVEYHAANARRHLRAALEAAHLSLIRTEDVIAATKIVEKQDA